MKKIEPSDIVSYQAFCTTFPIKVDVVYAEANHKENHFGQIYHPQATMWGHRDLVKVVLLAAYRLNKSHGWVLTIKDCLRPVEAQSLMMDTPIVKANPHWLVEPRFLSGPGQGGHPRGMAVDMAVEGVDFGTAFDHFSESTEVSKNLAHRDYPNVSAEIHANRKALEEAMVHAANDFNLPMLPLPQEWWDFRFPSTYTKDFAPLSNDDLLPHQKITSMPESAEVMPDPKILEELSGFII